VVDDPARYSNDPAARECAPGPHAAVWRVSLGSRAGTWELPIFVDDATPSGPVPAAYALRLCPILRSAPSLVTRDVDLWIEVGLEPPTARGRYTWSALVTPPELNRTFEVRSVVPLPQSLTLRAKHEPKKQSVVLSGRLMALGDPRARVTVQLRADVEAPNRDSRFTVRTDAAGRFSVRRRITETTTYVATALAQLGRCGAPSSAPAGCRSESVSGPNQPFATVELRKPTDPELEVRARDRARAQAANVRRADLPPGWAPNELLESPTPWCPAFTPDLSALTATGEAKSPVFWLRSGSVSSRSSVYLTEAHARTSFSKEATVDQVSCKTALTARPFAFPRVGDESRAFRVKHEVSTREYFDVVVFRRGRVVVHLWVASTGRPLTSLERSVAAKMAARAGRG